MTLSGGAVYFFQAGTEDLVNEWVSTCNYWAARQSREPLSGGVSNMEYGWSRIEQQRSSLDEPDRDDVDPATVAAAAHDMYSDTFSIKSGRSNKFNAKRSWGEIPGSVRSLHHPLPADRTWIHDWKPPMHPAMASTHDEETQLESLQKQVGQLKTELGLHNELRQPMSDLVSYALYVATLLLRSCVHSTLLALAMLSRPRRIGNKSRNISWLRLSSTNPSSNPSGRPCPYD